MYLGSLAPNSPDPLLKIQLIWDNDSMDNEVLSGLIR